MNSLDLIHTEYGYHISVISPDIKLKEWDVERNKISEFLGLLQDTYGEFRVEVLDE